MPEDEFNLVVNSSIRACECGSIAETKASRQGRGNSSIKANDSKRRPAQNRVPEFLSLSPAHAQGAIVK